MNYNYLCVKFGSKRYARKWEFGLARVYKEPNWKILNKEFGSTYLCNRLSHRWLGREGKVVTGGCVGVVMEDSHFVLPVLLCW